MFYYAQTLTACGELKQAFELYKKRTSFKEGHPEEVFLSLVKCGELCFSLTKNWGESQNWFLGAYAYMARIEPLIMLTLYYCQTNNLQMAYMFINTAVQLGFPTNATLFVSNHFYSYLKWHLYIDAFLGMKQNAIDSLEKILTFKKKKI